jgi:hypothetical protein
MTRKLTKTEMTKAIGRSARKYGYSASTVRAVTVLKNRAVAEYRESKN